MTQRAPVTLLRRHKRAMSRMSLGLKLTRKDRAALKEIGYTPEMIAANRPSPT